MFEFIHSVSIDAEKRKSSGEAYISDDILLFQDHFPGTPVLPGTFLIELAAQVAGLLAEEASKNQFSVEKLAFLGMVRQVKLLEPVYLPAALMIISDLKRLERSNALLKIEVNQNNAKKLQGEVVMMMVDPSSALDAAVNARNHRLKCLGSKSGKPNLPGLLEGFVPL